MSSQLSGSAMRCSMSATRSESTLLRRSFGGPKDMIIGVAIALRDELGSAGKEMVSA
ncbi:hypothetical protein [Saccharopolyspora hattusasensis]|uniref:hypothetical protein n=1 Tax=Saccharopolyspora hattusasensis TaxID=1128679 RepID=UPI003D95508A